jgi:hypothetical protein
MTSGLTTNRLINLMLYTRVSVITAYHHQSRNDKGPAERQNRRPERKRQGAASRMFGLGNGMAAARREGICTPTSHADLAKTPPLHGPRRSALADIAVLFLFVHDPHDFR